jgi:defect-in-organelle-trafficking protein DotC
MAMAFDMVPPPDFEAALTGVNRAATEISISVEIPKIRLETLKEAALGYGARSGLARRSYEIARVVYNHQDLLDNVFNFNALLLDKSVVPPVLSEAQNTLKQPDSDTIRIADTTYRIERQAAFVTTPPNWRDYLVRDYRVKVELPHEILLPKNDNEKKLWQQYVSTGWDSGVRLANAIFEQSLGRLERDIRGMILYRSLLAKGMIGLPYVAESNLGVTGDGNSMNVNDRILRITAKPKLETNPAIWKPIVAPK